MALTLNPALERIGTESAFALAGKVAQTKAQGVDIINLGLGQPDFPTPEHICEAAVKAIQDGHHGYTPPLGIMALRETVANYLNTRYGISLTPQRIAIMPGGKPTMNFAITIFAAPGAEIIYPDPSFPIYGSMIRYAGATPVPVPLKAENDFVLDIDDIAARLTDKTRLLIVNSPHNPTGSVNTEADWRKLEQILQGYPDCAVMSDEIYSHFTFGDRTHFSMLQLESLHDRLILLDGFSKSFAMTGWRLGFSVWPESLMPHVFHLAVNSYSCTNAPAQFAGIAALTGDMSAVFAMRDAFAMRAQHMYDSLNAIDNISCVMPQGAFYIFPDVSATGREADVLADRLLFDTGVAGLAGEGFGASGKKHIRFSCVADPERIGEAMQRVASFLANTPCP